MEDMSLYEIETRVQEDSENFIFETISPFCEQVLQRKISKKELEQALLLWAEAKKRVMNYEVSRNMDYRRQTE